MPFSKAIRFTHIDCSEATTEDKVHLLLLSSELLQLRGQVLTLSLMPSLADQLEHTTRPRLHLDMDATGHRLVAYLTDFSYRRFIQIMDAQGFRARRDKQQLLREYIRFFVWSDDRGLDGANSKDATLVAWIHWPDRQVNYAQYNFPISIRVHDVGFDTA